jgi:quinol monooxygenase YgiN
MVATRRHFLQAVAASAIVALLPGCKTLNGETAMYGLIGKMKAQPGMREALIAILLDGVDRMPGCLSYVVGRDPSDLDAVWVTEVWDSEQHHKASLVLPQVRNAITQAMPIIAGFDSPIVIEPVGGFGLLTSLK